MNILTWVSKEFYDTDSVTTFLNQLPRGLAKSAKVVSDGDGIITIWYLQDTGPIYPLSSAAVATTPH